MKNLSFGLIFLNLVIYAGKIPTPLLIFCWVAFIFGLLIFRQNQTNRNRLMVRKISTTGFLIIGLFMIKRIFNPILTVESALSLLLLLLVLKLYELENYEDYFHLFLITVLVQSGLLILDPTFFSLVFSLVNIVLTFIFVIKINRYQLGSVNFKRLFLYLLPAIPLCFLLFFFFPRFTAGFIRLPDPTGVMSGLDAEINFSNLGAMNLDTKTVFKANFLKKEQLGVADLYWRGTVLWDTDGMNWREGHFTLKTKPLSDVPAAVTPDQNEIKYQLVLEDLSQPIIPLLERPITLDIDPFKIDYFRDHTFQFKHPMYAKKVLTATSVMGTRDLAFDPQMQKRSLRVKKFSSPKIAQFLTELFKDIPDGNQAEKLARLKDFFHKGGFTYTLNPPIYNSLEEFLFQGKLGYCSHFSSSFAVLARLAGIPARVVSGYQGGDYNELGNFYSIEARDAHAWVEVFDKSQGWIKIDPTELIFPVRITLGVRGMMAQLNPYMQFANIKVRRNTFEFKWLNQVSFFTSMVNNSLSTWFYEFDQDYQKFLTEKMGLKLKNLPLLLITFLILMLTLFYLIMRAYQSYLPLDRDLKPYLKLIKKMERRGLSKLPYEGPLHFKERCLEYAPEMAEQIEKVINGFIQKRYRRDL